MGKEGGRAGALLPLAQSWTPIRQHRNTARSLLPRWCSDSTGLRPLGGEKGKEPTRYSHSQYGGGQTRQMDGHLSLWAGQLQALLAPKPSLES